MTKQTYILTRCKAKIGDAKQKRTHFGTNKETLCGKQVNASWFIEASGMDVTCKKCNAELHGQCSENS